VVAAAAATVDDDDDDAVVVVVFVGGVSGFGFDGLSFFSFFFGTGG
jgi:hypothetical protein